MENIAMTDTEQKDIGKKVTTRKFQVIEQDGAIVITPEDATFHSRGNDPRHLIVTNTVKDLTLVGLTLNIPLGSATFEVSPNGQQIDVSMCFSKVSHKTSGNFSVSWKRNDGTLGQLDPQVHNIPPT
jgi:hypothetical protein